MVQELLIDNEIARYKNNIVIIHHSKLKHSNELLHY